MINIQELKNTRSGRPATVLGGGPSLKADLARIPLTTVCTVTAARLDPVMIGVNHHWERHVWKVHFTVFMDDPARDKTLLELVKSKYAGVLVSPLSQWSEVDLTIGGEFWTGRFSGHLATWLACWMGCDPVLLCGMDCYQGEMSPDADPRDNAYKSPLEEHLAGWREALKKCPNPERIKAMSGPLVEIFGLFPPQRP
jgi:hypothetical protein